jgi:hypothetical protein
LGVGVFYPFFGFFVSFIVFCLVLMFLTLLVFYREFCSCVRSLKILSPTIEGGSEDEVQADLQDTTSPLMPVTQ